MIDPMCHPIVTRAKLITIERNNHLMAIMILAVGAFIDLRQRHRLHREMSIQIKLVMQQTVQLFITIRFRQLSLLLVLLVKELGAIFFVVV